MANFDMDINSMYPHTFSLLDTGAKIEDFKIRVLKNRGNTNPDGLMWMIPNFQEDKEHFDEELFTI
jgi:hypothetical protein